MGILPGSGPLGSGPTGPGSGFSVMPKSGLPDLKGFVSSSIPCTCRLLAGLCLSPFSWAMKMATTKANQETTRARLAG